MKIKNRNYFFYLEDMHEAMFRILEYIEGLTYSEFKENNLVSDAVIRNLEIIGEASKNIPASVKEKYPQLPWKQMYGLRNLVVHEYFGIDYENIWKIISEALPENIKELESLMKLENRNRTSD
jgi:uncharacterized protein with HEPN domain